MGDIKVNRIDTTKLTPEECELESLRINESAYQASIERMEKSATASQRVLGEERDALRQIQERIEELKKQ